MPHFAVTFDFGQTLCDLDTGMLSRRLTERGISVPEARLEASLPEAWSAYDAAIHGGLGGHPWGILMRRLLAASGVAEAELDGAVQWLWLAQPTKNLWRRPVPGMIEIVDDLLRASIKVGMISNSEGRLAELLDEIGWRDRFAVIADSGKLGLEKPGSPIFHWAASELGASLDRTVHIGDSLAADVEGALNAGMMAIWFRGKGDVSLPPRARVANDAAGVRAALFGWGFDLKSDCS
jgi:HAD superfamily hydrolase (TIGR01509 family)